LCYLGGTPHGLMDVFGLRSTEIDGLYDWENNVSIPIEGNSLGLTSIWQCNNLCDLVKVTTAEVLGTYGEDFYEGMPTITRNSYGQGNAYYICADFEQGFYDEVISKIVNEAKLEVPAREIFVNEIPRGIEVTTRKSEENTYIFIQNFNKDAVDIELDLEKAEILFGDYSDGRIRKFGTIVIRK